MTRFKKLYIALIVRYRYPVVKEYITLAITDQETVEIAFVVVTPSRNSLDLYINTIVR